MNRLITELNRSKGILTLFLIIAMFSFYFSARYTIGLNKATTNCLKTKVFLIDKWDREVINGQLIAFEMNVETDLFAIGSVWVKKVAGSYGDTVRVDHESVTVGKDKYNLHTSYVFTKLGRDPETLQTTWNLADDQIFMIGDTLTSFDSRFWGPINKADVRGRAYAIF
jgi:conjugal transfer pilin signal peptidase TrbI